MDNLTGAWIGELDGTNQGRVFIELTHEGDRVYGEGRANEPRLGIYGYKIQGVVRDKTVNFVLTPSYNPNPNVMLGNVEASGSLDIKGRLVGTWKSTIGTAGTFVMDRKVKEKTEVEIRNAVFIVHGHDEVTKEKVARFVEKLGLTIIILHEQINKGMTVIEKFEDCSKKAGFAIALFTPDDVAYPLGEENKLKPRARQNVVLEMGYFAGLLGRQKIFVLCKGEVEIPSDILGIVYTQMDEADSWKLSLAKELKGAGYEIDLNKLLS